MPLVPERTLAFCVDFIEVEDAPGLGLNFLLASVSFILSHTLSLDSFCKPTAGKSSSPAGLYPPVYAYVVDCAPASPYAYSSSTHRFPDERTPIEATPLSATSAELLERAPLLLLSHTIPFTRVH